jgi:hypothetical protein
MTDPREHPEWLQRELDEARAAETWAIVRFLGAVAAVVAALVGAAVGVRWLGGW